MNLSMDEIRQILSEVLKLLATPEFQTQLEKSRQSSANDAVALLQSVRFFNYRCCGFSHKKSHSLERILIEHIDNKVSLESKLQIQSICSSETRSRSPDIVEKLMHHIFNLHVA